MTLIRITNTLTLATLLTLATTARATEDCPAIVYPHYALAQTALPTRVIANTVVYGYMYLRFGAAYVASLVNADRPKPVVTDLYQRPQVIETRMYCPGSEVLVHGKLGSLSGLTGNAFDDVNRRAVYGVPADAKTYLVAEGTLARVEVQGAIEVLDVGQVGLAGDVLYYPPLTKRGDDGQVDVGTKITDCEGRASAFSRVFSLPGQSVKAPQDLQVEFGHGEVTRAVKDLCVELNKDRQIDVDLRQTTAGRTRARVTGYRGFDRVIVRYPDHTEGVISRVLVIKH